MMTSSNGSIFRVTGHLCGEFTGQRWIPRQRPATRSLMFSLICPWMNGWVNNRKAGDLRRHRTHYDVRVMWPVTQTIFKRFQLTLHTRGVFSHYLRPLSRRQKSDNVEEWWIFLINLSKQLEVENWKSVNFVPIRHRSQGSYERIV